MAECLKSAYDFIKSAFAIRIGVLSSQDAEIVSQKNNLSFSELIQPFCTLTNEAHIQGFDKQSYRAYNMHLRVSDIRQSTPSIEKGAVCQLISDLVQKSGPDKSIQNITVPCRNYNLSVNRSCPWFDTYRDLVIRFGLPQDHEFLNHHIACMLVVSSLHPNPMQEFANLSQLQNHIQHRDQGSSNCKWMTPNTMKYFVLLHDVQKSNEEKAKSVYASLQTTYGSKVCYFLRINSRDPEIESEDPTGINSEPNLPDPWYQFMNYSTTSIYGHEANAVLNSSSSAPSINVNGSQPGLGDGKQKWLEDLQMFSKTSSSTEKGFGCFLTMADHDQLRTFMQDFILQALIPHMEKTIKNLNEQISAKKAIHRSIFRATRTLFGSGKSQSTGSLTSYNSDANELLVRKIADLCFLSQMYDQAFSFYHNARKDYTNDQAWLYAAGASEMAAISNFMQRNSQKTYPAHYMESALTTYIDVCKNDYLALRSTLIHAECLQLLGMNSDAAYYLIKLTAETDDLRSALLLEQAAHCFLKLKDPQPRKFAFHLILAGHRFSKCAQRRHALRCYGLALQVYMQQGWTLAEDHINFTMARQSFNLKQLSAAANSFRMLLTQPSSQSTSQQAAFFHEFIHIFQQFHYKDRSSNDFAMLELPKAKAEDAYVFMEYTEESEDSIHDFDKKICRLEAQALSSESVMPDSFIGSIKCFCELTTNTRNSYTAVGDKIKLNLLWHNYLDIELKLSNIFIQWKFKPDDSSEEVIALGDTDFVRCLPISRVTFPPGNNKIVGFMIEPLKPGLLSAIGTIYNVGMNSEDDGDLLEESDSFSVKDYQAFEINGHRLNSTKNEQCGIVYGADHRLDFTVFEVLPKLSAKMTEFPRSTYCNEVIERTLFLKNEGTLTIDVVKVLSDDLVQFHLSGPDYNDVSLPGIIGQPIPNLLKSPLAPSQNISVKVCTKAPQSSGDHRADILFFYKSNSMSRTVPSSRAYFMKHYTNCKEVVHVQPKVLAALDQNSFVISLLIKNVANDEDFMCSVTEVTCATSNWSSELVSHDSTTALPSKTSLLLYLILKKNQLISEKGMQNKKHMVSSCIFPSNSACQTAEVIVHWKQETEAGTKHGQHCLNMDDAFATLSSFSPSQQFKISTREDAEEVSLEMLHHLVSWKLQYNSEIKHDFAKQKLCHITINLVLCNLSNYELCATVCVQPAGSGSVAKPPNQVPFSWLGITEAKKFLPPQSRREMRLFTCFSCYGVFNISSVSITAIPDHMKGTTPQLPQKPPCGYFISISENKNQELSLAAL